MVLTIWPWLHLSVIWSFCSSTTTGVLWRSSLNNMANAVICYTSFRACVVSKGRCLFPQGRPAVFSASRKHHALRLGEQPHGFRLHLAGRELRLPGQLIA